MGTHSLFLIRIGDDLWGFHGFYDGVAWQFYEKVKDKTYKHPYLSKSVMIFLEALDFYTEEDYDDHSYLNLYKRKYNPFDDNIRRADIYFDGNKFIAKEDD